MSASPEAFTHRQLLQNSDTTWLVNEVTAAGRTPGSSLEGGCRGGVGLTCEPACSVAVVQLLSRVRLFVTPRTVAYQAFQSMGFSRQEYWSGLPFLSPGDLPNPGMEPKSPALEADALPTEPPGKPI